MTTCQYALKERVSRGHPKNFETPKLDFSFSLSPCSFDIPLGERKTHFTSHNSSSHCPSLSALFLSPPLRTRFASLLSFIPFVRWCLLGTFIMFFALGFALLCCCLVLWYFCYAVLFVVFHYVTVLPCVALCGVVAAE